MKKTVAFFLGLLLLIFLAFTVSAEKEEPKIIAQPQNPTYNEFSVALYSVTVKGSNLTCYWFLEYEGVIYNISDITASEQPWTGYAGASYGSPEPLKEGDFTTFTYFFNGIGKELNGAKIYAEIEDGHYSVTTQKAYVTVVEGAALPPTIDVPAEMTVYKDDVLELYCEAVCPDGKKGEYLWYETSTGLLQDIIAINRGSEMKDIYRCDTSEIGTRYYICAVTTASGGSAYSSAIKVNVLEKPVSNDPPEITTKTLPEATVGQDYSAKLLCTDPNATFGIYYNPGKANDFEKTGLTLAQNGEITGIPSKAGSYSFAVCAAGQSGEGYMTYTIVVKEAPVVTTEEQTTVTELITETTAPETEKETEAVTDTPTEIVTDTEAVTTPESDNEGATTDDERKNNDTEDKGGFPVWGVILVAVGAAGIGVCSTLIFLKKKK